MNELFNKYVKNICINYFNPPMLRWLNFDYVVLIAAPLSEDCIKSKWNYLKQNFINTKAELITRF